MPLASRTRAKRSHKPATLADVARLAGVVPMTASRAINGTGYVSAEVRERVLCAVATLQYRPNMLARSLKGRRLHAVGVMLPDVANPFAAELVDGIQQVLDVAGYSAFLTTAHRSVELESKALRAFVDHRLSGIIVATRGTEIGDEAIAAITRQGVPVVTVGRPVQRARVDCVTADHWHGAFEATSHLVQLGHRKIGFIGVSADHADKLRRFQGYADALKRHRIPLRTEWIAGPGASPAYSTEQDGYEAVMKVVEQKELPTALLCRNDYTAIGALHALRKSGLRVPQDVAVASFDNTPLAAFTTPPLTSVSQPIAEQGRRAAEFLLDRIEARVKNGRRELTLKCHLIVRESSDLRAAAQRGKA